MLKRGIADYRALSATTCQPKRNPISNAFQKFADEMTQFLPLLDAAIKSGDESLIRSSMAYGQHRWLDPLRCLREHYNEKSGDHLNPARKKAFEYKQVNSMKKELDFLKELLDYEIDASRRGIKLIVTSEEIEH